MFEEISNDSRLLKLPNEGGIGPGGDARGNWSLVLELIDFVSAKKQPVSRRQGGRRKLQEDDTTSGEYEGRVEAVHQQGELHALAKKDDTHPSAASLSIVLECKEKKPKIMTDAECEELARGFIKQHLSGEVLCNAIKDAMKHTWEKLEEMFETIYLSNKLFLNEKLHSLKMEEGANMMEHHLCMTLIGEGLIAESRERGRSSKREGKKSNRET
ncbi:hypothetical protein L3X38_024172 [Prunus dulcis]|uniref:Uncharacterized protein n=1 Tax=Prunus dulcis TaxID=3755 RepID=A0AAD4W0W6_PRUDU|nr:hypothetical protein L3X38_024172 [Prunus dulcis]